jgi:hypothetical protein
MERENARGLPRSRSPDGREFAPGVLATWCETLRARTRLCRRPLAATVLGPWNPAEFLGYGRESDQGACWWLC